MAYFPTDESSKEIVLTSFARSLARLHEGRMYQSMELREFDMALEHFGQTLVMRKEIYSVSKNLSYTDRTVIELAAVLSRPDLIEAAMGLEAAAIEEASKPIVDSEQDTDLFHLDLASRVRDRENALEKHGERIQHQKEALDRVSRYKEILRVVHDQPGMLQTEVAKRIGLKTDQARVLLERLEAADSISTMKVGNRIRVWPQSHPAGPTLEQRRLVNWSFGTDREIPEMIQGVPTADVPEAIHRLENLRSLFEEASVDKASDREIRPTVWDFTSFGMDPIKLCGYPLMLDSDNLQMVIYGHLDLAVAKRLGVELILDVDNQSISRSRRNKWLMSTPRHGYVERKEVAGKNTYGEFARGWILHEVSYPTDFSVAATFLSVE